MSCFMDLLRSSFELSGESNLEFISIYWFPSEESIDWFLLPIIILLFIYGLLGLFSGLPNDFAISRFKSFLVSGPQFKKFELPHPEAISFYSVTIFWLDDPMFWRPCFMFRNRLEVCKLSREPIVYMMLCSSRSLLLRRFGWFSWLMSVIMASSLSNFDFLGTMNCVTLFFSSSFSIASALNF